MARLVLSLDGQTLAEYNMTKERYTVGRLPDNDIRIDNAAVSGHHSLIINILNDSFLEDLNSTNGTYVNGKLIKKHALQHDDLITVGHHQLRFLEDQVEDMPDDEFEKTMVIEPSGRMEERLAKAAQAADEAARVESAAVQPAAAASEGVAARSGGSAAALAAEPSPAPNAEPEPEPAKPVPTERPAPAERPAAARQSAGEKSAGEKSAPAAPSSEPFRPAATQNIDEAEAPAAGPPLAKLQVLSGTFAGRELELAKTLTTLGRPGIQVAAISRRAEGYYIVHVESGEENNYPKVNGASIGPQARALQDNDVIQLAGVKMGFFLN